MPTRRSFIKLSSLGAVAASARAVSAQPAPPVATGPLPPSIAALSSMKALARPVTVDERRARVEKARRLMAVSGIDGLLLAGGTSLVYFGNVRWWISERFFGIVVPLKGTPFVVCPAFEEDRAREQLALGPFGDAEVRTWQEDEDPYALVATGLKNRGIAAGRLGIEEKTYFNFADGVGRAAPALKVVSATPVTAGCRMIKSPHEIELMRLASAVTLKAYAAHNADSVIWLSHRHRMASAGSSRARSCSHV